MRLTWNSAFFRCNEHHLDLPSACMQTVGRHFRPTMHSSRVAQTAPWSAVGVRRHQRRAGLCAASPRQAPGRGQTICRTSLRRAESDVAARVWHDYCRMQRPARHNVVFSKALKEFTTTAVLAYQCGYNEGTLREELSGSQSPAAVLEEGDLEDCILALGLVWLTLAQLPASSSRRWATSKAVSDQMHARWGGFVRMIVKGYFEKRWAYHPIDRLQMEVSLVTGRLEKPSTVAEWSRLVYAALEHAAPQWPADRD